jgi:hypothetical protein
MACSGGLSPSIGLASAIEPDYLPRPRPVRAYPPPAATAHRRRRASRRAAGRAPRRSIAAVPASGPAASGTGAKRPADRVGSHRHKADAGDDQGQPEGEPQRERQAGVAGLGQLGHRRGDVPRLRRDSAGQLVRGGGSTEVAERILPMLPALHDVLIDHKAEFAYGAHDPSSPRTTRPATRSTPSAAPSSTPRRACQRAFTLLSGRGVLATNRQPAKKNASQADAMAELEGTDTAW